MNSDTYESSSGGFGVYQINKMTDFCGIMEPQGPKPGETSMQAQDQARSANDE